MATPNEEKTESIPSTSQKSDSTSLVGSPKVLKIVLSRIDEGGLDIKTALEKDSAVKKKRGRPLKSNSVKRLGKPKPLKKAVTKEQPAKKAVESRGRNRPRKDYSILADMKPRPKVNSSLKNNLKKAALKATASVTKPYSGSAKNLLKKTTLQNRSKIAIPPIKKGKPVHAKPEIVNKSVKTTPTPSKAKKTAPTPSKADLTVPTPLKADKTMPTPTPPKSNKTMPTSSKANKTLPMPSKVDKTIPTPSKAGKVTPTPMKTSKKTPASAKSSKSTSLNVSPPKPKLLPLKSTDSDSSDDEFLYDELIEELGNTNKNIITVKPANEAQSKTTNITLKPNAGNKPPTIVKGGIVKKTDLPPDLKSIASPSQPLFVASKRKISTTLEMPVPSKKPSPWPISISPAKSSPGPQKKANTKVKNEAVSAKKTDKLSSTLPQVESVVSALDSTVVSKSPITTVRPKIGPKQTAKVVPLSKPSQDDYMSDEYTEIETLEEAEHLFVKSNLFKSSSSQDIKTNLVKPTSRINSRDNPNQDLLRILSDDTENPPNPVEQPKEPNLASKEAEDHNSHSQTEVQNEHVESNCSNTPVEIEVSESVESGCSNKPVETESPHTSVEMEVENTPCETENQTTNIETEVQNVQVEHNPDELSHETTKPNLPVNSHMPNTVEDNVTQEEPVESMKDPPVEEEPPVRTVYDIMNDITLKYPSWNLHIIPETNAFCIAQVTKGRLGLPTLKKCIELDPETYCAKVYIHQYHIKRFDNVYDSEESILALIEEIHSIKA